MVDAPQVSNGPDPISQMQHIGHDVGSNLSAGWVKSIDDYINGLIHEFGDKAAALGAAAIAKTVEFGGQMKEMGSKAVAPFNKDYSPSASMQGPDSPQHGLGKERQHNVERSTGNEHLGQLTAPHTPAVGVGQAQSVQR